MLNQKTINTIIGVGFIATGVGMFSILMDNMQHEKLQKKKEADTKAVLDEIGMKLYLAYLNPNSKEDEC